MHYIYSSFRKPASFLATVGLALLLCAQSADAQNGRHLWTDVSRSAIEQPLDSSNPLEFRAAHVDLDAFFSFMTDAPLEERPGTVANGMLVDIPLPDGNFATYRMVESSVMAPGLQERYPMIRTFLGQDIDAPSSTIRMSVTPHGVHAISSHQNRSFYLDPLTEVDKQITISYWLDDMPARDEHSHLGDDILDAHPERTAEILRASEELIEDTTTWRIEHGTQLRIYRLAMAANFPYVQWHSQQNGNSPNVTDGLAGVVAITNRVNMIFERDVAIRMILVENNDEVIFADQASDPYTGNHSSMINQNQTTLNTIIGNANYDIGHVVVTLGGGLAQVASVCHSGKARAVSGLFPPSTNSLAVQIVAHEMGHQFSAMHTFNASISPCGPNRSAGSAVEPGGGSTIMSYAGSCGSQNIQGSADDYFHNHSIVQMISYINGAGNTCAEHVDLDTDMPIATLPAGGINIPLDTPFRVEGGFEYEGDESDLTFTWEGIDLGPAGPPPGRPEWTGNPPFFRSVYPSGTTMRTLPRVDRDIHGLETLGEGLPSFARLVRLRYTVRNNAPGAGSISYLQFNTNSAIDTGPFVVTSQDEPTVWNAGSQRTITWDVANTDQATLGGETMDIYLSRQLANQFILGTAIPLAMGVPNTGSATVTLPTDLPASSTARVFVVASDGYFYSFNTHNITLDPEVSNEDEGQSGSFRLSSVYPNPAGLAGSRATINLEVDISQNVEVEVYDALGRFVMSLHSGMLNAGVNHQFAFNARSLAAGTYYVRAVGESFTETRPMTVVN